MITADEFLKACEAGNIDIVKQYIAEGGDIEARDLWNWTAVRWAARNGHIDCLRELINAGANIEYQDCIGWTALNWAIEFKQYDSALLLVEAGADIYTEDMDGIAAIDYCRKRFIKSQLIKLFKQHIQEVINSQVSHDV